MMPTDHSLPAPRWMTVVLKLAGIYNLLWGTWVILWPNALFELAGLPLPNYPSIVQCLGMVIGVYGIGYWIAARDPARHWPIVLVGLLGKIFGPIGFVWTAAHGELPWSAGVLNLTNDVIWWLPFTAILLFAARANDWDRLGALSRGLQAELQRARLPTGESLWDLSHRQPLLLVFLRHAGCTFCREALNDLRQHWDAITKDGSQPVVVHMGDAAAGERLRAQYGVPEMLFVSDPERRLYRAFDLPLGTMTELFGPTVCRRGTTTILKHGVGPMIGNGLQMPGAFIVDHGQITAAYRHRTAADRPDYVALTESCRIASAK